MLPESCAAHTSVSVIVPSASRAAFLHLLLIALLKLKVLRQPHSEIIVSHATTESLAERPQLVARVRKGCSECNVSKISQVDSVVSNEALGCAHRYAVGMRAVNHVLIHLDDDLIPMDAIMVALVQHVCAEPGFPHYDTGRATPRPAFYGTTPRLCDSSGYQAYPKIPTWLFARRYFVLTNIASLSRSLNNEFVVVLNRSYAPLMQATHGEGCDLVFNNFVIKQGSRPTALRDHLLTKSVGNLRVQKQRQPLQQASSNHASSVVTMQQQQASNFHGGYERLGNHYATRYQICRCLAANHTGAALRACGTDAQALKQAARLWGAFKRNMSAGSRGGGRGRRGGRGSGGVHGHARGRGRGDAAAVSAAVRRSRGSAPPRNSAAASRGGRIPPGQPAGAAIGSVVAGSWLRLVAPTASRLRTRSPFLGEPILRSMQLHPSFQHITGLPSAIGLTVLGEDGRPSLLETAPSNALPLFAYNPSAARLHNKHNNSSRLQLVRIDPFGYCRVGDTKPLVAFPPHAMKRSHTALLVDDALNALIPCAEDARFFSLGGRAHAAFVRYAHKCGGARGPPRVWIASLQPHYREVQLSWPRMASGMQKNWLPFVVDGTLYMSYSLCPHVVLRCELESGACVKAHETRLADCSPKLRGGAAPVAIRHHGVMLGVAHTTSNFTSSQRGMRLYAFYEHFLYLQRAVPPFDLVAVSPPFRFAHEFGGSLTDNIQFCSGLQVALGSGDASAGGGVARGVLTLTYGVGDCVARAVQVNLSHVLRVSREPLPLSQVAAAVTVPISTSDETAAPSLRRKRQQAPLFPPRFALNATRFHLVPAKRGVLRDPNSRPGRRLLHVISSLASSNTLGRNTINGKSRLPMIKHSFRALVGMCAVGFEVTVVLIAAWAAEHRRTELTESLSGCGAPIEFGIWEVNVTARERERELPAMHRYVVADLLPRFDVVSCWEDDMLITLHHVAHFLDMSAQLERAAAAAPEAPGAVVGNTARARVKARHRLLPWRANLTRWELLRIFPALVRVEILADGRPGSSMVDDSADGRHLELTRTWRKACCTPQPPSMYDGGSPNPRATQSGTSALRPRSGAKSLVAGELVGWEWGAFDAGLRHLPPPLGWVASGPSTSGGWLQTYTGFGGSGSEPECTRAPIGSPRNGVPSSNTSRCSLTLPRFWGQQGGWMATREQISRLDEHFCPSGFLPGGAKGFLARGNTEFLSGGIQHFASNSCGIARIFSLSKQRFGNHLILHMSGNKQLSKPLRPVVQTYRALRRALDAAKLQL